ncbi:type II toxin-antitoxin system VapC family toxin [Synechococcus sp. CCFWC 502]|nr:MULTISPECIES: type II toxin-antitoxin system VapC family toxin [unclassified Synechococcus]WFN60559.1 type II toxin-antitoxin system VapC family toxin [Synechococcus sp. CCFWC 502]
MLWWLLDDPRLRPVTRVLMTATPCVVSVASIWEVAIKHHLGKLPVAPALFRDQSLAAGASILPVLEGHVIETAELPPVHGDPFDRLLIAQARLEGLMAVSSDAHWCGYDLTLHRV